MKPNVWLLVFCLVGLATADEHTHTVSQSRPIGPSIFRIFCHCVRGLYEWVFDWSPHKSAIDAEEGSPCYSMTVRSHRHLSLKDPKANFFLTFLSVWILYYWPSICCYFCTKIHRFYSPQVAGHTAWLCMFVLESINVLTKKRKFPLKWARLCKRHKIYIFFVCI